MNIRTILLFFAIVVQGQEGNVGINTENPVITLDVVGMPNNTEKADGFLSPRLTGDELFAKNNAYNIEHKGTLVYITKSVSATNLQGKTKNVDREGYYFYNGSEWEKVKGETTQQDYELKDVGTIFATEPIRVSYKAEKEDGTRITPLGIVKKIIVPAGSKYQVLLDYSVPMGASAVTETYKIPLADGSELEMQKHFNAYMGAKLLKNNKEIVEASRKFSMPMLSMPSMFPMNNVASSYSEILDNSAGTSDLEVIYNLSGYLEIGQNFTNHGAVMTETDEEIIIYNMYSTNDDFNFNWGKTSLRYQVYKVNK